MFPEDDPYLVMEPLDGLRFFTPVGLAPGLDPLGEGVPAFFDLGFGFVEVGPTHKIPQRADLCFFFCKLCYSMLFPTCQARLVRFYCQLARLRLLLRRTRRTWTATSGSKWPPPDLNCKLEIAVSACLPASLLACVLAFWRACLHACLLSFLSFAFNYLAFALAFVFFCCCFFLVLATACQKSFLHFGVIPLMTCRAARPTNGSNKSPIRSAASLESMGDSRDSGFIGRSKIFVNCRGCHVCASCCSLSLYDIVRNLSLLPAVLVLHWRYTRCQPRKWNRDPLSLRHLKARRWFVTGDTPCGTRKQIRGCWAYVFK